MKRLGVVLCVLSLAGSAAAEPPPAASVQAGEAPAAAAQPANAKAGATYKKKRRALGRPAFLGLMAATFLIIGALAGANDKISKP